MPILLFLLLVARVVVRVPYSISYLEASFRLWIYRNKGLELLKE
jgi:hypothetical protein